MELEIKKSRHLSPVPHNWCCCALVLVTLPLLSQFIRTTEEQLAPRFSDPPEAICNEPCLFTLDLAVWGERGWGEMEMV